MTDVLIPDQVYRIDLGIVNAYLVDDGEVTLVDAGTPGALDTLRECLADAGYAETDIDRVLVTHFDLDHVGTLAALDLEAPVHAMEPDASFLDGSAKPPLSNQKGLFQRVMNLRFTAPDAAVERVPDGGTVGKFTAYHTPGHTPGHTVYGHAELPVALLGDLVREDDGRLQRPPWFINYDTGAVVDSIRSLADRNLEFDVACMGHGEPITEGGADAFAALARHLG